MQSNQYPIRLNSQITIYELVQNFFKVYQQKLFQFKNHQLYKLEAYFLLPCKRVQKFSALGLQYRQIDVDSFWNHISQYFKQFRKQNKLFDKKNIVSAMSYQKILIICFSLLYSSLCSLTNGDFELPYVAGEYTDAPYYPSFLANSWFGKYQVITSLYCNCMTGQYVDTVVTHSNGYGGIVNEPGYLTQVVFLNGTGNYNISFQYSVKSPSLLNMMRLDVNWNGVNITSIRPTVMDTKVHLNFSVVGNDGGNSITFNHSQYDPNNFLGFFIDNVAITLINLFPTNSSTPSNSSTPQPQPQPQPQVMPSSNISFTPALNPIVVYESEPVTFASNAKARSVEVLCDIISLPRGITALTQVMFLVDDLWLYNYDEANYSGIMEEVFQTAYEVERVKWALINLALAFNNTSPRLPTSDYSDYGYSRFLEVEGKDSIFVNCIVWFLIFTIPQTIIILVITNLLFRFTKGHYMSKYIRRYCFKAIVLQMLFEGNVNYFTFLFFNQMRMGFFFRFMDKFAIQSAVLLYGLAFVSTIGFFVMVNFLYLKHSGYFIYYFYRLNIALYFLTFKIVIRPLIQGAAHSLLHFNYPALLAVLMVTQIVTVIWSVIGEINYQIFLTRTQWVFTSIYHFVFIILNLGLLAAYLISPQYDETSMLNVQQGCVIIVAICTVIICVADFMPRKSKIQVLQNEQKKVRDIIKTLKNQAMKIALQQKPKSNITKKFVTHKIKHNDQAQQSNMFRYF